MKLPKRTQPEPTPLDMEITRLHSHLLTLKPDTNPYDVASNQLVKLYKLREDITSKKRVSTDSLVNAASSLGGILLILHYEHAHVITTKALGFVAKSLK